MSRFECDHCGALQDAAAATEPRNEVPARSSMHCKDCGALLHPSQDDRITMPMPLGVTRDKELEQSAEAPETTRTPVTDVAPPTVRAPHGSMDTLPDPEAEASVAEAERDTVVTNPPFSERPPDSAIPLSASSLEYIDGGPLPAPSVSAPPSPPKEASEDEEAPLSGTPSVAALVESARARRKGVKSEDSNPGVFLEAARYDRRPPEIRVDAVREDDDGATPLAPRQTDAPVSGTKPPAAASERSAGKRASVIGFLLLGAAAAFVATRRPRDDSAAQTAPAAAPLGIEAAKPANDSPPQAAPAGEPTEPRATEATPATVAATEPVNTTARGSKSPSPRKSMASSAQPQAPEPEVVAQPEPAEVAFDANAANAALAAAATRAGSCRSGADPSGVATVTVTFSPAGRVTTATVSGPPFAGTETGSCIASTLRAAQVPAFAGDFMTVKKTVTIR